MADDDPTHPDREALARFIHDAMHRGHHCAWKTPTEDQYWAADALISARLVRGPVTRAQIEAGARCIAEFHGREFQRHLDVPLAYQVLAAAGLSVEGDKQRG